MRALAQHFLHLPVNSETIIMSTKTLLLLATVAGMAAGVHAQVLLQGPAGRGFCSWGCAMPAEYTCIPSKLIDEVKNDFLYSIGHSSVRCGKRGCSLACLLCDTRTTHSVHVQPQTTAARRGVTRAAQAADESVYVIWHQSSLWCNRWARPIFQVHAVRND